MIGYIDNNLDGMWKPCTEEKFYEIVRSQAVARTIAAVRAGNKNRKRALPAFLFCGEADMEAYRNYVEKCRQTGERCKGSRCAQFLRPTGLFMMDFDRTEGEAMELYRKFLSTMREAGIPTEGMLMLAHRTPSGHGLRLVLRGRKDSTPEADQRWIAGLMNEPYDAACKDISRLSYAVTVDDLFFVDGKLLFSEERRVKSEESDTFDNESNKEYVKSECSAPTVSKDLGEQSILLPSLVEGQGGGSDSCFKGIPYENIVQALAEQLGGIPEHGARNNFIFSMACHLRYVTNDDPEWIAQVLPTYGEARDKWMATIRSACARSQTKTMPRIMRRTLAICKERLEDNSEFRIQNTELAPPPMPRRLPPLIKLLVSRTPRVYRAAVAHAVFPALGAHLWKTRFRYIDNVLHEATLMNVLVGETGAGKNCISEPINHILRDIRQRDMENLSREREWKREMVTKGANKDKRQRPEGLVIQEIDPDMTNAAFVQRLADAEERFLYTKMNEIDQFDALKTSARSKAHFQIMCLSFDPDNVYGQTRVGTSSVSERVCIRFNWNAATTIRKGQAYFQGVLTDGPISRINFCMIPPREIGSEMPVYGSYDAAFDEELRPYIECLTKARGTIECRQAMTLAKRLVEECAETARLSQNRVYENLSFRANVIAYLKAMVLYVAHGERWDKTMEEFVRWSLHYDLWCKMHLFGEAIEAQEATGENKKHRGPQNLLDLLPEVFTREEAGALRTRMGVRGGSLTHMLNNWKQRGYIELYGEEMTRDEAGRQRYIKTEEYLRRHGGKLKIES